MSKKRRKSQGTKKRGNPRNSAREVEIEEKVRVFFPKKPPPTLSKENPASMSWEELGKKFPLRDQGGNPVTIFGTIILESIAAVRV